jgi:hypothetical protein
MRFYLQNKISTLRQRQNKIQYVGFKKKAVKFRNQGEKFGFNKGIKLAEPSRREMPVVDDPGTQLENSKSANGAQTCKTNSENLHEHPYNLKVVQ